MSDEWQLAHVLCITGASRPQHLAVFRGTVR
jgi:hypothetical protein